MSDIETNLRRQIAETPGFGRAVEVLDAHIQVYAEYLDSAADPRAERLARLLELMARGAVEFVTWRRSNSATARPLGYFSVGGHGSVSSAKYLDLVNAVAAHFGLRPQPDRLFVPDATGGYDRDPPDFRPLSNLELLDAVAALPLNILEDACRE